MQKYLLTCLPVVCAALAPLSADDMGNQGAAKKNGRMTQQGMREITPQAPALAKYWADPFITAEYIYWRASETGLQYTVTGLAPAALNSTEEKGHVHKPEFDYDSGFKVGAGLKFKHDGWDLYANYTWLQSDENKNSAERETGEEAMQTLWDAPVGNYTLEESNTSTFNAAKGESDWTLHFNALDLELGRNYFISPRLTLRPHFGLKFAWIDQDMEIEFENTSDSQASNEYHYHFDQDQFGVGIRAGLNTAWFMWNKWSVFGNFAATALYSDFDVHRKTEYQQAGTDKFTINHFNSGDKIITPVLEFALGLRFQTDFSRNNYQFMLQAGWEEQIWFDMNHFTNFVKFSSSGNLTLQGLTVKAGFAF